MGSLAVHKLASTKPDSTSSVPVSCSALPVATVGEVLNQVRGRMMIYVESSAENERNDCVQGLSATRGTKMLYSSNFGIIRSITRSKRRVNQRQICSEIFELTGG